MNSKDRIPFLNTYYHNLSMAETLAAIQSAIIERRQLHHTVINAGKVVQLQKDLTLRTSVNDSDIINIDGQAVIWAAKFLSKPVKARVAGIDLMEQLVDMAARHQYTIYLLGAKEEVISRLVSIFEARYGQKLIVGFRNGYFSQAEEIGIFKEIEEKKPNMLFIAISTPKKENLLYTYKNEIKSVNLIMGVGGSFDVLSGYTKRAPLWMQKIGMEWFFRFIQEPLRMWKRYLIGNVAFLYLLFKAKLMTNKTKTDA
ncbi:MAG: WecB/TagA/CpsF family glycosyltransferase [Chitinophagales bacterium]|nr:WecB/TagA/CpsF family glycosyltransferase [Chitinophagales bacterium]